MHYFALESPACKNSLKLSKFVFDFLVLQVIFQESTDLPLIDFVQIACIIYHFNTAYTENRHHTHTV